MIPASRRYLRVHQIPDSDHFAVYAQWARRNCLTPGGSVITVRVLYGIGWRYEFLRYYRYVYAPDSHDRELNQVLAKARYG